MGLLEAQSSPAFPARGQRSAQHKQGSVILEQVAFTTRSMRQDHASKEQWNKDPKHQRTWTFQGRVGDSVAPEVPKPEKTKKKTRTKALKGRPGTNGSQEGMSDQRGKCSQLRMKGVRPLIWEYGSHW